MNPQDVCGYAGSCLECVEGQNYYAETVKEIICCVANMGTLDDEVRSVARSLSDCPAQPVSVAYIFGVTVAVLTLLVITVARIIWKCTQQRRQSAISQQRGFEDVPLVSFTSESVDSFDEATYKETPMDDVARTCPIVHDGVRTYVPII